MNSEFDKKFKEARALFPHTENVVYFNSASYGPFSTLVQKAIVDNVDLRLNVTRDDSHDAFQTSDELRKIFANFIGAAECEVGIGLSTSHGLNIAAFGLPLKDGDEVLLSDIEFPAAVYAWREASERRGLKLKYVESTDLHFDIDKFEKAIGPQSRVLCLSFVQFFNGYKNDLVRISEICKKNEMFFVVDGIQGMGVEPIDVKELGIDIFASGCQKWMLAPQGCGFFFLSDACRGNLSSPFMSWLGVDWQVEFTDLFRYNLPCFDSARKYEMGYYVVQNLLAMKASAGQFDKLTIPDIQKHNHALIDRLADFVTGHSYYKVTSAMEPQHRSSIFTFSCDRLEELHRFLLQNKIVLVRREGSIRVSVHLFNDESDIERLIELLGDFAAKNE